MTQIIVRQNHHIGNDTLVVNADGTRINQIKDSAKTKPWLWLDMRRTPLWIYNNHTAAITVGLNGSKITATNYPNLSYSYDNVNWTTIAASSSPPRLSLAAGALVFLRTNINWASIGANGNNRYGQYLSLYSSRNSGNIYIGGNIMSLRGITNFSNYAANSVSTTELRCGTLFDVRACNMSHLLIPNTNAMEIFGRPTYVYPSTYILYEYKQSISPVFYVNSSSRNLGIIFNKYTNSSYPNVLQVLATSNVTPTFTSVYIGANCATTGTIYYSDNITWTTASDTTGAFNAGIPTQWTRVALNSTNTTKL